jgi:predicted kinase
MCFETERILAFSVLENTLIVGIEMNYVIGLCGTHGTGKSTVIKGLKEAGIPVDDTQLSRTAQKMLGWDSLERVHESAENLWSLQDAILAAMYDRDKIINESQTFTIVDRTPADVAAYTLLWMLKLDYIGEENRHRYDTFRGQCRTMASRYALHVYFPIREEIPFVAEAQRAKLEDREMHDRHINNFLRGVNAYEMSSIAPDARVAEVIAQYEFEKVRCT